MDTQDARPLALATRLRHHPRRDPRASRSHLSTRVAHDHHQPTPRPTPAHSPCPKTGCQPQPRALALPKTLAPRPTPSIPSVTTVNSPLRLTNPVDRWIQ